MDDQNWRGNQSGGPSGSARPNQKWFFIKKSEDGKPPIRTELVFLDDFTVSEDDPNFAFDLWAHRPTVNGEKLDFYMACLQGVWPEDRGCVNCLRDAKGDLPFLLKVCTVINTWITPEGEVKYIRKLFGARVNPKQEDTYDILLAESKLRGGLTGKVFSVVRTKGYLPSGTAFSYIRDEPMIQHPAGAERGMVLADRKYWWTSPRDGQVYAPNKFDYLSMFRPFTNQEMATVLGVQYAPPVPLHAAHGATSSRGGAPAPRTSPTPAQNGSGSVPMSVSPEARTRVWKAFCEWRGWDSKAPPTEAPGVFLGWVVQVTGLEEMRDRRNWVPSTIDLMEDAILRQKAQESGAQEEDPLDEIPF